MSIENAFTNLPNEAISGISEAPDVRINGATINKIVEEAMGGYLVYETRDFYGNKVMRRRKKPKAIKPKLNVILHLKVCSFLGDYGAGKTIKTTSLLPGEKTRISIKTYKQSSVSKKTYESVLDSFSKESSSEFEDLLETETGLSSVDSEEKNKERNMNLGANATVPVRGIPIGLAGGFGSSVSNTTSASLSKSVNALNSSLSKQAQRASSARNVEVNTEQEVKETSGEEREIIREFENINYSRVLNFVFRQLMQEYITITYLDDISIEFTTGYSEHYRTTRLNDLDAFLDDIFIVPTESAAIKNAILNDLVSIEDYQGN